MTNEFRIYKLNNILNSEPFTENHLFSAINENRKLLHFQFQNYFSGVGFYFSH